MPHLAPTALAVSEEMRYYRRTATAAMLALLVAAVVVSTLMVLAVTGGDVSSTNFSIVQDESPDARFIAGH
jgi:hypothetical protein